MKPNSITSIAGLKAYFAERINSSSLPSVVVTKGDYRIMCQDEREGILAQILKEHPQAAEELIIAILPDPNDHVLLTFHLENENVGEAFCLAWESCATTEKQKMLEQDFRRLSSRMNELVQMKCN